MTDIDNIIFEPKPTHPRFIDIEGRQFSRLLVLGPAKTDHKGYARWFCQCNCGSVLVVNGQALRNGNTKSCGCLRDDKSRQRATKHGMSNCPEYTAWQNVISRCEHPQESDRQYYKDKGIKICKRWRHDFQAFYNDLGDKPSAKHSIDRKDSTKHYSCGKCSECVDNGWEMNCRWATSTEQSNNVASNIILTWNGKTQTLGMWATELHINYYTLWNRIARLHWSVERSLTTSTKSNNG